MVYQDGNKVCSNQAKICESGCGIMNPNSNRYLEVVWNRLNQIRYGVQEASSIINDVNDYLVGGYPEPNCAEEICSKEPVNQREKIDEILEDIENSLNVLHSRITKLNKSI